MLHYMTVDHVHGIVGLAPLTAPTHIHFYLFLCNCMKRFLRILMSCHSLPMETGIINHLRLSRKPPTFHLDHLDFAHIVLYLALGMNIILVLSVQFPATQRQVSHPEGVKSFSISGFGLKL